MVLLATAYQRGQAGHVGAVGHRFWLGVPAGHRRPVGKDQEVRHGPPDMPAAGWRPIGIDTLFDWQNTDTARLPSSQIAFN